jgi:hypothetical protein
MRNDIAAALEGLGPRIAQSRALASQLEPFVVAFADRQADSPLPINRYVGAAPAGAPA